MPYVDLISADDVLRPLKKKSLPVLRLTIEVSVTLKYAGLQQCVRRFLDRCLDFAQAGDAVTIAETVNQDRVGHFERLGTTSAAV